MVGAGGYGSTDRMVSPGAGVSALSIITIRKIAT